MIYKQMNHYDEYIIELYVLQSETVEDRRPEIERHLAECHGCRSLAEQIEQFYADVETALREGKTSEPIRETALTRYPRAVEPYYEPYTPVKSYGPATITGRIQYFIRKHPITTGVGSFAIAAALVGLALYRPGHTTTPTDSNPAYHHINPEAGTIEIYNSRDEKIREFPTNAVYHATNEVIGKANSLIRVTDLDGDGRREIVIGMSTGAEDPGKTPLHIYASDGSLLLKKYFTQTLQWRGSKYSDAQNVQSLAITGEEGSSAREIFVVGNNGRSPNTLYRLSKDGDILGEYNHFGSSYIKNVRFQGSQKDFLLFYGQNDTEEPHSLDYATLIVLDPSKLTGVTEAGDSRGFGLPPSAAEEYILRFPLSDMHKPLLSHACVISITEATAGNEPRLNLDIRGSFSRPEIGLHHGPSFHFIVDTDFNVDEVKYDSPTMKQRQQMVEEGILKDIPTEQYLADLKDAVLYWNGTGWQKEATRVNRKPGN